MTNDHIHKLDIACILCVKNKIEQLEKFKRFVMDIATNQDQFWKEEAKDLLREIKNAK